MARDCEDSAADKSLVQMWGLEWGIWNPHKIVVGTATAYNPNTQGRDRELVIETQNW